MECLVSSCSLAIFSARPGSIESTRTLWTSTLCIFSAMLHDCPKHAVQDFSCSRAALVRSLVKNRWRSLLGSFLTATTSFPLGRSCCILCFESLTNESTMRISWILILTILAAILIQPNQSPFGCHPVQSRYNPTKSLSWATVLLLD
jgi:hypothetical protein